MRELTSEHLAHIKAYIENANGADWNTGNRVPVYQFLTNSWTDMPLLVEEVERLQIEWQRAAAEANRLGNERDREQEAKLRFSDQLSAAEKRISELEQQMAAQEKLIYLYKSRWPIIATQPTPP